MRSKAHYYFLQISGRSMDDCFRLTLIHAMAMMLTAFLAVTPAGAQKASSDAAHGKALAELNCGRCHAVGLEGESTHKIAPPFWTMSERRPVESIAEMLLKQTSPDNSDMPHFKITAKQADDIAAWIAWVQPIAHGKRLVKENCARCHAVGVDDVSPHANAPTFREIYSYYPIDGLEEGFAEGIVTGHPDMPVFKMQPLQIADIIAYMESLQVK